MSIAIKRLNVKQKLLALIPYAPDWCLQRQDTLAFDTGTTRWQIRKFLDELVLENKIIRVDFENGKRANSRQKYQRISAPNKKDSFFFEPSEAKLVSLHLWNDVDKYQLIEFYHKSGLVIVPAEKKKPVMSREKWLKKFYPSLDRVLNYFDEHREYGIGHWNYSFLCVDYDYKLSSDISTEADTTTNKDCVTATLSYTTTPNYSTLTVQTRRGRHEYFHRIADQRALNGFLHPMIDIKCNGAFVMLPDNTEHCDYRFDNLSGIISAPIEMQNYFSDSPNRMKLNQQEHNMKLEQAYPETFNIENYLVNGRLPSGRRHITLWTMGRSIRHRMSPEEVAEQITTVNRQYSDPPLKVQEIEQIIGKVFRQKNTKEFIKP